MDAFLKNLMTTVPLVSDLRSPAMRPRHWKLLMDATKKPFTMDDKFKLGDLLALELHKFEDEVSEIVDRAQKEDKLESGCAKLKDVWGKVEFEFHPHKGSAVQTVKLKDEDFEMLEDNQVLVQGMMANR
jgi:dynein heavy chain, axonemal